MCLPAPTRSEPILILCYKACCTHHIWHYAPWSQIENLQTTQHPANRQFFQVIAVDTSPSISVLKEKGTPFDVRRRYGLI